MPGPVDKTRRAGHPTGMIPVIQVALGGALGASARFYAGKAALRLMGPAFPWGTMLVNVLGSLAMGLVVALFQERIGDRYAPLLMTGLLGGFTTFSAFSLDAVLMFERGQSVGAAAYVLASVILSILALVLGLTVGRALA